MNKKSYEAPKVVKVTLEIQNAVLGVCHTSITSSPFDTCKIPDVLQPCAFGT